MSSQTNRLYLDHAATSPATEDMINTHAEHMRLYSYNSSTVYEAGLKSKSALEKARENLAQAFNVKKTELFFTSGGTESNNMAIHCLAEKKNGVIWYSETAHPSLLLPSLRLAQQGWTCIALPMLPSGAIDTSKLSDLSKPDLITLEWVNSEVGFIQDISELQNRLKQLHPNCKLIVDGVQGIGKLKLLDLNNIDAFSMSGHKFGAPVGVGCLILKNYQRYQPMNLGGGQENGLRSGTTPVPLILSFEKAFQKSYASKEKILNINWNESKGIKPFRLNCSEYSPYVYMLNTVPVEGEVLLHHLEQHGIMVGLGSACSASKKKMSHSHKAIGLTQQQSRCTIRISFTPQTPVADIEKAVKEINNSWQSLTRFF